MPTETAYQSQSESAEPENRETHGQGDILSFELLSANDEHPVSPSTAEHVEAATNLEMYAQDMQMWLVLYTVLPLVTLCISDHDLATQV